MRLAILLLCCLLLCGCSPAPLQSSPNPPGAQIPAPVQEAPAAQELQAVLWFRCGEEPLLAPEGRSLRVGAGQSLPQVLLQALLSGPSSAELSPLFPQGTRLISVTQSGRRMFVTLSRHILNAYGDEPSAWQADPLWAREVPLRRTLAMQAIAATLSENCPVDEVVILVETTDAATDSLRLREGYYTLDGNEAIADPLRRDESLLLTPGRTAEVILQCWQDQDFVRLYRYLASTDPATGAARPAREEFLALMAQTPVLISGSAAGGSLDGQRAVFTLSGQWLRDGQAVPFEGLTLRLTREKGVWRVGLSELTGREALP